MKIFAVTGTMRWTVRMVVEAESAEDAESQAMDRMDDGSLDGFDLVESQGDNEVTSVKEKR